MDNKKENDRFYKPESAKKAQCYMEYAPEIFHTIEANSKGLKFTNGKKYPVLERKNVNGREDFSLFKTINDKETETWVDEKYFIACSSDAKLLWEDWNFVDGRGPVYNPDRYVSNNHFGDNWHDTHHSNTLSYADEQIKEIQRKEAETAIKFVPLMEDVSYDEDEKEIDIRQMAKEKNVQSTVDEEITKTFAVLSGISHETPNWELDAKEPEDEKYAKYDSWKSEDPFAYTCIEGKVKDTGTPLVHDLNKCMAAISKVFGKGDIADPDDLIIHAKKYTTALITWKEGFLAVDGAKTKITYDEAQNAFKALQKIGSQKVAKKIIGKLLADKVKTLF